MSESIIDKYKRKAHELHEQNKTGHECSYCGILKTTTNNHGTFCAGCGVESRSYVATCFGIPVDSSDIVPFMKEIGELYYGNFCSPR